MSSPRLPKPASAEVGSEAARRGRRERTSSFRSSLFEIAYVLDSFYKVPLRKIADAIRATLTYPGVNVTDDCSWPRVLDHWPEPLTSITDAAIVAVALANKYDSVATFDQKLIRRMKALGVESYF